MFYSVLFLWEGEGGGYLIYAGVDVCGEGYLIYSGMDGGAGYLIYAGVGAILIRLHRLQFYST